MRKPWEKSFAMRRARLGIKKLDKRSRLEKPIKRRRLTPRHSENVQKLLNEISDLKKADHRGLVFDVVLDIAKKGRPYEKLYAKLLLSALAYCDKGLDRFHPDMRRLGLVLMHRKGEEGRWMREAIMEGHGYLDHVQEEDEDYAPHVFWDEDDDDDGGVLVDA